MCKDNAHYTEFTYALQHVGIKYSSLLPYQLYFILNTIMPAYKKKYTKKQTFFSKLSHGTITFTLLITVVIIGSILLVGGIVPQYQQTARKLNQGNVIPVLEDTASGSAKQDGLHLKTLKFKQCGETAAVTLQLDITGSMKNALPDLKTAVLAFTDNLSEDSVIGIQAYSDRNARVEVIPVSLYANVKDQIRPAITSLTPGGGTPSYAALQYSKEILQNAMPRFPERQFTYIFFSDGNPNVGPSKEADIKRAADEIKSLGVTVYAIGFGNINRNILSVVASSPDKAKFATNSKDLQRLYTEISTQLCGAVK